MNNLIAIIVILSLVTMTSLFLMVWQMASAYGDNKDEDEDEYTLPT